MPQYKTGFFLSARAHLRQGAKVLVDMEDQEIFDDVLEGKITEPTSTSE